MSKKFSSKNSQRYVVVHRPHDDPSFYDTDASAHVLVPVSNPNNPSTEADLRKKEATPEKLKDKKAHVGEAALYGIGFDDSKYDYTQHLKPIGLDPENSIFIASKDKEQKAEKKNIEDLFLEPKYRRDEIEKDNAPPVFQRGMAKPEYLLHQQDTTDEIRGFKPDMNPALREVLEALEDEAYVVNDDIVVEDPRKQTKAKDNDNADEQGDDIFAQLLGSGEVNNEDEFEDEFDEWDIDNVENFEDENYVEEMAQFDNIENLEELGNIDYQADVRRFQKDKSTLDKFNSDDEFSNAGLESVNPSEEEDVLGELPSIQDKGKTGKKKRRSRQKKGAMSDVSGFSMSSSAIARTETMTVLDDQYDQIITGYENYEEELEEDEEKSYQPFDMATERSDFESMLDDFLDNYELESGGRKLAKKDEEIERLKEAADEVSKGKLSQRRNRERKEKKTLDNVTNTLSSLKF
ncbi:ltv1p [Saccharomyces arboricola H-6]|uniref:Ltv1p n=1 Tax=Saccharomyces arboricola (strain H-6 / AS 2.3317 / CBS 10644) TaxID=1160507 RepID=J8LLI9_SACAR|nr:ltv1p [Saccharomyces arboricola H-6]